MLDDHPYWCGKHQTDMKVTIESYGLIIGQSAIYGKLIDCWSLFSDFYNGTKENYSK